MMGPWKQLNLCKNRKENVLWIPICFLKAGCKICVSRFWIWPANLLRLNKWKSHVRPFKLRSIALKMIDVSWHGYCPRMKARKGNDVKKKKPMNERGDVQQLAFAGCHFNFHFFTFNFIFTPSPSPNPQPILLRPCPCLPASPFLLSLRSSASSSSAAIFSGNCKTRRRI